MYNLPTIREYFVYAYEFLRYCVKMMKIEIGNIEKYPQ